MIWANLTDVWFQSVSAHSDVPSQYSCQLLSLSTHAHLQIFFPNHLFYPPEHSRHRICCCCPARISWVFLSESCFNRSILLNRNSLMQFCFLSQLFCLSNYGLLTLFCLTTDWCLHIGFGVWSVRASDLLDHFAGRALIFWLFLSKWPSLPNVFSIRNVHFIFSWVKYYDSWGHSSVPQYLF